MPGLSVNTGVVGSGVVVKGYAYSRPWRVAAAVLAAFSGASLLFLFGLVLWADDPPITPAPLFVLFGVLVMVPAAAAELIRGRSAAEVEVDHLTMSITRRGFRLEVPSTAIKEVMPWVVPLPGCGFSLRMGSGRRLRYGVEVEEPSKVLRALVETGEVAAAERAVDHPTVVYASAKSGRCPSGWPHAVLKFVVFSLLPAGVLFYAHQHIAYGGTLGEYYLLGLGSYVTTFLTYWAATTIYLILYAAVWRVLAEAASLAAAWWARDYATPVRRAAENICRLAYYGGVPVLLLLRFLP